MSRKISAARRDAFLRFLAESGNQTLSAERAKVSRSWVCLQRSGDPAFDAACVAAIAGAQSALRQSQDERSGKVEDSPSTSSGRTEFGGSAYLDGVELVVSGTNGVRTQVRRARLHQWTPRVEARFLDALSASCNVKAALAAAGMSKGSAYARRQRLPAFARAWDEAIAIGCARLECLLIQNIDYTFDPEAAPPEVRMAQVTVMDVIRTLGMYQRRDRQSATEP